MKTESKTYFVQADDNKEISFTLTEEQFNAAFEQDILFTSDGTNWKFFEVDKNQLQSIIELTT